MLLIEETPALNDTPALDEDVLEIEWYETNKAILRRKTRQGRDVALRRQGRTPLRDGEILWRDGQSCISVTIRPCACLVISPRTWKEMGQVCFEIGNMHLPIYIDDEQRVNVAYDSPLHTFLQRRAYEVEVFAASVRKSGACNMKSFIPEFTFPDALWMNT